jgi:outer membrane protein assembly factor BamB
MDSKLHNDDREEDDDELVFQNLIPEKPANAFQRSIIQIQQHWPPRLSKRPRLLLVTVLSSLLVIFLLFELIHISTRQNSTTDVTINGSVIPKASITQMLPYANSLYVLINQTTSNNGQLEAIDAQTGKLIWSYAHHNTEGIKLLGNILYIQTDTNLVALNATNRKQLWENPTFSDVSSWQADQDVLFTSATDGIVTALNASTGAQLWQANQPSKYWQVDDGIFYTLPTVGSGLRALNAQTGKQLWENPNILYQNIKIDDGQFYLLNTAQQRVQAFDGRTGKILWQLNTHGNYFIYAIQNGILLLSNLQGTFTQVISGQAGKLLWQHSGELNFFAAGSLNQIEVTSQQKNELDILRISDGKILYHILQAATATDNSAYELFSLRNGLAFFLYVTKSDNVQEYSEPKVVAMRMSNGATVWSSQKGAYILPLQNNTIVIKSLSSNSLLSLRADNGQTLWQHTFGTTGN